MLDFLKLWLRAKGHNQNCFYDREKIPIEIPNLGHDGA